MEESERRRVRYREDGCQGDRDDQVECNVQKSLGFFLERERKHSIGREQMWRRAVREGIGRTREGPEIEFPERLSLLRLTHFPRASGKNPEKQPRIGSRVRGGKGERGT
jgi:hypothetical protein